MTILELEQRTGLDRSAIRYYEREGLISPNRKENSYRDYSEENANEIMKIKLLRQLDLPVETIKQLQQGSVNITDVLRKQASALENEIQVTQRAAAICKEISDNVVTYQNLDAVHYLDKLAKDIDPTETVTKTGVWDTIVEYHPVRRFIARMADYVLLQAIVRFLVIVVFRVRPLNNFGSGVITYGCLLLSIPVQASLLHYFATTPGKWLMGIQLFSYKGHKLDMANALQREWEALLYGYGLGIPVVKLWRLYRSYKDHNNRERLHQDIGVDHVYSHWEIFWHGWRKAFFAIFCVIIILINCINIADAIKPKYRGSDLTIAEFAENYNFYSKIFESNGTMDSDGTWYVPASQQTGAVIVTGSKAEKENEPFRFETEGETIRRITYENSWQDIYFLTPVSGRIVLACITAVASQEGVGYRQIIGFLNMLETYEDDEAGEIRYENIEIIWNIESTNCIVSNGTYYTDDETKETL